MQNSSFYEIHFKFYELSEDKIFWPSNVKNLHFLYLKFDVQQIHLKILGWIGINGFTV